MKPVAVKLRCSSWPQLEAVYNRDLKRGVFFLSAKKKPSPGTPIRISITIPSGSTLNFRGTVSRHLSASESPSKRAGFEVDLQAIPVAMVWIIESALLANKSVAPPEPKAAPEPDDTPPEPPPAPPPLEDLHETAAAEYDLVQALTAERRAYGSMSPFQILGVDQAATDQDVHTAFGYLARKYHPDHIAQYGSDAARAVANDIFVLIRESYEQIGHAQSRARAWARLHDREPLVPAAPTAAVAAATPKAQPARAAVAVAVAAPASTPPPQGVPEPATPALSSDFLFGDMGNILDEPVEAPAPLATHDTTAYTEAERLLDLGEYDDAIRIFDRMLIDTPRDRGARVGKELATGCREVASGNRTAAAKRFEAALKIDPMNERAARELGALRRNHTDSNRTLLGRLLGKGS